MTAVLPLLAPFSAMAESKGVKTETTEVNTATVAADSKSHAPSWRASKIIGTNVKNAQDETVGEVEDLIVDWKSGEIVAVVVSTGGFLGIADSLNTVSVSALKYDSEHKMFRTSMSKADLEKEPRFTSKTWPDYDKDEGTRNWRATRDNERVEGKKTSPDNTEQNEKDRSGDTKTPLDQGNSEIDVKLTKDIRSSVVDADLSFNAKNIKIVTQGGHVTLRGVVESAAEHQAVLKIAHKHADASKVTDQLKVNN